MSAKLTRSQRCLLEFAAKHPCGRIAAGGISLEPLLSRGLVALDGFNARGLLFKITDAGRLAVATSTKASKKGP